MLLQIFLNVFEMLTEHHRVQHYNKVFDVSFFLVDLCIADNLVSTFQLLSSANKYHLRLLATSRWKDTGLPCKTPLYFEYLCDSDTSDVAHGRADVPLLSAF